MDKRIRNNNVQEKYASSKCNIKEKKSLSEKHIVLVIIAIISLLGIIGPYLAQVILPAAIPDVKIQGIEIWNQYVSLILGVVATIMSVISLILCFRSEEKSNVTANKINEMLIRMDAKIDNIKDKQTDISYILNHLGQNIVRIDKKGTLESDGSNPNDEEKP